MSVPPRPSVEPAALPGAGLRIGVSSCFFHADPARALFKGKTLLYVEQDLAHWLMRAGALPLPIPAPRPDLPVGLADYAAALDGLVLHGGSDVAPESYGQIALRPEWAGDRVRDLYELALARAFLDAGKPVFGVCRGLQLINVLQGGTLTQDIPTQVPGARVHRDWNVYEHNLHPIALAPGGHLAALYGVTSGRVCSVHHQAIATLGRDLVVEARCPDDGVIEAIAHEGRDARGRPLWLRGVQWHPEWHDPTDPGLLDGQRVLLPFLDAARAARADPDRSPRA